MFDVVLRESIMLQNHWSLLLILISYSYANWNSMFSHLPKHGKGMGKHEK